MAARVDIVTTSDGCEGKGGHRVHPPNRSSPAHPVERVFTTVDTVSTFTLDLPLTMVDIVSTLARTNLLS
jgi:hypothetical protein